MPRFSIIVPIYNVEKYLPDCLNSILSQSFNDYEIVCINDGSLDKSGDIAKEYRAANPQRIVYFEQDNGGLSAARNTGLELASGEYVCFVDSDDMLSEDALLKMNLAIERNPNVEIVNFEMAPLLFDGMEEDSAKENYYRIKQRYDGLKKGVEMFASMMANGDYVESANLLLINREWLKSTNISFTPGALYEDSIFSIDCFLKSSKVLHIVDGLYVYRIRANSIMTAKCTLKQFTWRVWQYKEVLKRIFENDGNVLLTDALSEYAKMVIGSIKNTYRRMTLSDKTEATKLIGVDGLVVSALGLDECDGIYSSLKFAGLIRKVEKAHNILIYGAGSVGNKVCKTLDSLQLGNKIEKVAVSCVSERKILFGHEVVQVDKCDMSGIDLIVVATVKDHGKILADIRKYTECEVVTVDFDLEEKIDAWLNNVEA